MTKNEVQIALARGHPDQQNNSRSIPQYAKYHRFQSNQEERRVGAARPTMTALAAKVTAIEKRGVQYQVVVQIGTPKYRGSFNTLVFGEIKPHSGFSEGWPAGLGLLSKSRSRHRGSVSALDSTLMEKKRKTNARLEAP